VGFDKIRLRFNPGGDVGEVGGLEAGGFHGKTVADADTGFLTGDTVEELRK
jgi:hypothetical protein